jgi:hypothetical protein
MEYGFISNLSHVLEPSTFNFSCEIQNVDVVKLKLNVKVSDFQLGFRGTLGYREM